MDKVISPVTGCAADYVLQRIQAIAAPKHAAYTTILLGRGSVQPDGHALLQLHPRVTRKIKDSSYTRNPAIGPFIALLEQAFSGTYDIAKFDGYIVPSDGSRVTRLLFCREFTRSSDYATLLRHGGDRAVEAYELSRQLLQELDSWITVLFSRTTKANVDFLFAPYGYPENDDDAKLRKATLVKNVFGELIIEHVNIASIRDYLKSLDKRLTKKGMEFACTKLEHYLANEKPEGQTVTYAFPGDLDGVLFDKNTGDVKAIVEYKADTYNKSLEAESSSRYGDDKTRFQVLDDIGLLLGVPVIYVFWSVHHNDAKLVIRDAAMDANKEIIIRGSAYPELSEKIADIVREEVQ